MRKPPGISIEEILVEKYDRVLHAKNETVGLNAMAAFYSSSLETPYFGGCRMIPYKTDEEMQNDVIRLAKLMTYKNALIGLPYKGCKFAFMGDPKKDKNPKLLRAMGEFINTLHGQGKTGCDVNINSADAEILNKTAPNSIVGLKSGNPGEATGIGVHHGIMAAVKTIHNQNDLQGLHILVNGVGNVGSHALEGLVKEKGDLTIADEDSDKLKRMKEKYNVPICDSNEIYELPWDIICLNVPGSKAKLGALTQERILGLQKNKRGDYLIIGGGTNVVFDESYYSTTENFANQQKGFAIIPSYVINAGGVYSVASELTGKTKEQVLETASTKIPENVTSILKTWLETAEPMSEIAERRAMEILENRRKANL